MLLSLRVISCCFVSIDVVSGFFLARMTRPNSDLNDFDVYQRLGTKGTPLLGKPKGRAVSTVSTNVVSPSVVLSSSSDSAHHELQ